MAKKKIPALKIEMVDEPVNLHIMALLEYKREQYLCVIDNISPTEIGAYVVDYAEQGNISVQDFLSVATYWFYSKSEQCPLSVEVARQGLTEILSPMYRTFDSNYVARIIGQAFSFEAMNTTKVRRRRVVQIPESIAIRLKKPNLD
jgi:hypothetical protein